MNRLLIIQLGFLALTIIFLVLLLKTLKNGIDKTSWENSRKQKIYSRLIWISAAWIALVSVWSFSGLMINFEIFPLNFLPILAIPLITITWLSFFSVSTKTIVDQLGHHEIIRLQVFRVFVEILLWMLLLENLLPIQMSFEGRNFDILAGLTAPIVAYLAYHKKISIAVIRIWNFICLGLLINIVTIAILSMPSPFRVFMNEPSNTIVAVFPIALLPGFLVPLAYGLHFLSLRQISRQ